MRSLRSLLTYAEERKGRGKGYSEPADEEEEVEHQYQRPPDFHNDPDDPDNDHHGILLQG